MTSDEQIRAYLRELEARIKAEHPGAKMVIRILPAHRCGHCASCFRRGIVDALAVEVGEG